MRFLKFGVFLLPLLFAVNCVRHRVGSGAFAGDHFYLVVHEGTGNPYDPKRISSQLVLCNIDANDSLDCKPAVIKGLR